MNQKGSVLILSLWVLSIMVCLAMSLAYASRIEWRLTRYAWDRMRLVQEAKRQALEALLTTPGATDESARINLNRASPEVLKRVFVLNEAVVPEILIWRGTTGGDDGDYKRLGYTCRHGAFRSVDELQLVKNVTPDVWADVKNVLTVDTGGEVNINTASERVLNAMGLMPSVVQKILWVRQNGHLFDQVATIVSTLQKMSFMTPPEVQSLTAAIAAGQWTVRSSALRLDIISRVENSMAVFRVSVVASHGRILQWQESIR